MEAQGQLNLVQGGSNMTGTNCDFLHTNQSRSYLNRLVLRSCVKEYQQLDHFITLVVELCCRVSVPPQKSRWSYWKQDSYVRIVVKNKY